MTEQQRSIYILMRKTRILMNTHGTNRIILADDFEILRKQLGGLQYAPMIAERHNVQPCESKGILTRRLLGI